MTPPEDPPIYHITHVTNLAGRVADGGLWSDAARQRHRPSAINIGYQHIKQRRMRRAVTAGSGGVLGEYVPFYFCPRSVMLFVISRGSSDYTGNEREIVHLVSRVSVAVQGTRWAFSDRHAEVGHAEHFDDLVHLSKIQWSAVGARIWRDCREEKQAEFLVKDFFSWDRVESIGVRDAAVLRQVEGLLAGSGGGPPRVEVCPHWYYT
jgi:hypothetical protein